MKVRGLGRLRRAFSRMQTRFGPKAVILLYHRVAKLDGDPWELAVSPENFAAQLDFLAARGGVVPLAEIANGLRSGSRAISGKVAITFDDGYADNLVTAKPLLEERRLPATIFMTSGEVGRSREFWWDELERIFLQPGTLPERLELPIGETAHAWTLATPHYSRAEMAAHAAWRADSDARPTERHRLYREVYDLIQGLPGESREAVMDRLAAWAGLPGDVRSTHRALAPAETGALANSEWIEIGAHTITHQALSTQTAAVQEQQIRGSKEDLEAMIGRDVQTFSYPYGRHTDETVEIVRRCGFDSACACLDRIVQRNADPYRLPRLVVGDWSREDFATRLHRWLDS